MAKRLKLLTEPHPLLRQVAKPVILPLPTEFKTLIANMVYTMRKEDGIGLAAPQIGQSIRLIVVETKDGALPFINPVIIQRSRQTELGEEGCLSVPKEFGFVNRHKEITIAYIDQAGKPQKRQASGLFARVILHEIDHLDGVLFIDKVEDQTKPNLDLSNKVKISAL